MQAVPFSSHDHESPWPALYNPGTPHGLELELPDSLCRQVGSPAGEGGHLMRTAMALGRLSRRPWYSSMLLLSRYTLLTSW